MVKNDTTYIEACTIEMEVMADAMVSCRSSNFFDIFQVQLGEWQVYGQVRRVTLFQMIKTTQLSKLDAKVTVVHSIIGTVDVEPVQYLLDLALPLVRNFSEFSFDSQRYFSGQGCSQHRAQRRNYASIRRGF